MDEDRHQEIARCLFRESNDALFLFDPFTHRVLDLNPAAIRMTGYEKTIACTKTVWDLFAGESAASLDSLIEAYRKTGFYHSRDGFFLSRRRDRPIPVNISVSRIHTAPSPMGLVVVRDVSDRKKAEQALRESEARYRGLVETAGVVFWSTDLQGKILSLNPQFEAITGWAAGDCVGRDFVDLIAPEDRHLATGLMDAAMAGEVLGLGRDLRLVGKSGRALVLEFLSVAKLDPTDGAGISGIARDVTDLRNAAEAMKRAEAIQAARQAAEMADRAKSEFLAHVSHEIRTPMTSILGFIDLMLGDEAVKLLPAARLDDLRTIAQNGSHLLKLIDDILDISRIEAGKLPIAPSACPVAVLASEIVDMFQIRASEKRIALGLEIRGPVPASLRTDPLRLRQILINLIGNALKFTDAGSVLVRMEVAGRELASRSLTIDVIDTGSGMTEADISELFKPFSRPGRASEAGAGGTGLGLAISRRLAEMLGGSISVESTPGVGSRFRLLLPIAPGDDQGWVDASTRLRPAANRTPPKATPPRRIAARVLLAEDHPDIQRVTALHLEHVGARVVTARNGQEAIDFALAASEAGEPFDVVLMDMQMPVLDGYEATRQLRARGFRGSIIALTAFAMAEDRDECLRMGCNDHISKPVDWARLSDVLIQQLRPAEA